MDDVTIRSFRDSLNRVMDDGPEDPIMVLEDGSQVRAVYLRVRQGVDALECVVSTNLAQDSGPVPITPPDQL